MSNKRGAGLAQLILGATFLLLAAVAHADTVDESGVSIIISEVRSLVLDSESVSLAPGVTELLAGWTEERYWNATVSSNADWVLTIRGTEATWEGPWPKPVGDIWWENGGGEYVPLDTEPVEVCRGGPADHEAYSIHCRIALDPERDIPGDYFYANIVFELTTP